VWAITKILFKLHKFTRRENTAKSYRGYFFNHTVHNNVMKLLLNLVILVINDANSD